MAWVNSEQKNKRTNVMTDYRMSYGYISENISQMTCKHAKMCLCPILSF